MILMIISERVPEAIDSREAIVLKLLYVDETGKDVLREAIIQIAGLRDDPDCALVQRVGEDRYCAELDIEPEVFRQILERIREEGISYTVEGDTMAIRCLEVLESYETAPSDSGFITNPWADIFYGEGDWEVDEAATEEADPAGNNDRIIFLDGSELTWDERASVWREK